MPIHCPVCEKTAIQVFIEIETRQYLRCNTCLATFLDRGQLPSPEVELAQYQLHRNDPVDNGYRQFLNRLAVPLLTRLPLAQQGLDYGCGPGPGLARILQEAGHSMALYDPFFQTDKVALTRTYDFITCSEVVEHFHNPATEFSRLSSLLKPGGRLAVMTSFQTDDAHFANWHYRRDPTHVVFYREATFRYLASYHDWDYEILAPNVVLMQKQKN
jgi:SAM-dependent methyltransferase